MKYVKKRASRELANRVRVLFHNATDQRMAVVSVGVGSSVVCRYVDASGAYLSGDFDIHEFWLPAPDGGLVNEMRFVIGRGSWSNVNAAAVRDALSALGEELVLGSDHDRSALMLANRMGMSITDAARAINIMLEKMEKIGPFMPWDADKSA